MFVFLYAFGVHKKKRKVALLAELYLAVVAHKEITSLKTLLWREMPSRGDFDVKWV